jgi:CHAT domain-containing protein/tetratricopeptide (TPR) repeat protein
MKSRKSNIEQNFQIYIYKLLFLLIFSSLTLELSSGYSETGCSFITKRNTESLRGKDGQQKKPELRSINSRLRKLRTSGDTVSKRLIVDSLKTFISLGIKADSSDLADSYYLIGTYYLNNDNNINSLYYLKKASEIFEKSDRKLTSKYSNSLYNIGSSYNNLGDFSKALNYITASIENDKMQYGENSPLLIEAYFALSVININIRDNDNAIMCINKGLKIAQLFPDSVALTLMASLYQTKGVAFLNMANYEEAKNNLEKAETYYDNINDRDINYISLLDNLGTVYHFFGIKEKSYDYYEKGMKLITTNFSLTSFKLTNNYAIILGNDSLVKKGESLLSDFLKRARHSMNPDSRFYYTILRYYADYLSDYGINENLTKETYQQCFRFVNNHPWDKDYRDNVILGYSQFLFHKREYHVALDSIQTLLFPIRSEQINGKLFPNPDSIKPDVRSIKILRTKYQLLWSEYKKTNDIGILEDAAGTSELVISVLEKIRLNIGEEGSRLMLGDKYRDSYMDAIRCLNESYKRTTKQFYLEKAFEYSEKSKVASLLASTREMKAIQNHIPSNLANREKGLEVNIGFYSSILAEEENKENPDARKINLWKDYLLVTKDRRDSLIRVFEKNYSDYYALKYNTRVVSTVAIPGIIGRTYNYLSYILTDSLLYTFVLNSKYRQLITQRIDTSFISMVQGFRKLLTTPDLDEKAADEFRIYQVYGYRLYSVLIEPIKKYLISDKLIISPDNILSYLPFEAFLTGDQIRDDLNYGKLPYLMNDFSMTYEYSATLLAEFEKAKPTLRNPGIVFAPTYNAPIYIDSISNERQSTGRILGALPYALEEAEYVSKTTNGKLYNGTTATESIYKQMAGKFDIIHLAMHTYINNHNPAYSKLIFSIEKDSLHNNGLNAFEIYGIPLKSKMVVLSSCNTGSGNLRNGEGVLSLARGFICSGSKSVVMSLWEVDDKSGTDIVKYFYKNLKNGDSKSEALRKARKKYLKSAGTVRSFPFFWSTLVVYGDDSPIYYSMKVKLIVAFIPLLLLSGGIFYFKKR